MEFSSFNRDKFTARCLRIVILIARRIDIDLFFDLGEIEVTKVLSSVQIFIIKY